MTKTKEIKWLSPPPEKCDICGIKIIKSFVDGKIKGGPWGFMCPSCHALDGDGLGTGKGQLYKLQPNGDWLKVEG